MGTSVGVRLNYEVVVTEGLIVKYLGNLTSWMESSYDIVKKNAGVDNLEVVVTGHEAPQAPSPKATLIVSGVQGRSPWENFEVFEAGE